MTTQKAVEQWFLTLIGQLGAATPEQLNRTHYSHGSLTHTYQLLHDMADSKSIIPTKYYNDQIAYKLSSRGFRSISREVESGSLIRGSRVHITSHFLEANEPIIKALELQKLERNSINHFLIDNPQFKWQALTPDLSARFESELSLRQRPLQIATYTVIPDAFVDFHHKQKNESFATLFEWDKASIAITKIEDRAWEYVQLANSDELKERLGVKFIRVVWLTNTKKRAMQLMAACSKHNPPADLFAFGIEPEAPAMRFYFDPIFALISGEMVNLLPSDWREGWLRSS